MERIRIDIVAYMCRLCAVYCVLCEYALRIRTVTHNNKIVCLAMKYYVFIHTTHSENVTQRTVSSLTREKEKIALNFCYIRYIKLANSVGWHV